MFQVPAVRWTEAEVTAAHALPDSAVTATITVVDPPATLAVSASAAVVLRITNHGDAVWRHDIPAGRHICVGNHWALADGTIVVSDDGRALLPHAVRPSETVEISLTVRAPESPGAYLIEFDLVQEHVCWFAQKGSPVARVAVTVTSAAPVTTVTTVTGPSRSTSGVSPASSAGPADSPGDVARQSQELAPRAPFVTRVLRRLRGGTPTFEMHVVSRADVEARVQTAGGVVIRAVDDNAAGPGWLSYTYVCRKAERD